MQSFDDPMRSYISFIANALPRAKNGETTAPAASTPQPTQSLNIGSIDYQRDFLPVNTAPNPAEEKYTRTHDDQYIGGLYDRDGLGEYEPFATAVTNSNKELFRAFFMPREYLAPLNASMTAVKESTDRFLKARFGSQSNRGTNNQETRPFIAPTSAAMSEETFDFDAGRSVVNRLSGGGRVPKRDSSNKP